MNAIKGCPLCDDPVEWNGVIIQRSPISNTVSVGLTISTWVEHKHRMFADDPALNKVIDIIAGRTPT